ncbi:Mfa1 family fimbria major subunit [Bacteroides pyogenes]|uniref:Mfa1 family fimbria major subunit n=1 Tax=Bacteroides pyogenes TaxID=310300 RepID=UPI0040632005
MKINKFLVMAAMALGLGVFAACSNDDEPNVPESKSNTYVGINIAMPGAKLLSRALPDDYNKKEAWKGRDELKSIDVFLINKAKNTIDKTSLTSDNILNTFEGVNEDGFLYPKLAVKGTAGDNVKVYVVLNAQGAIEHLKSQTDPSAFEDKLKDAIEKKASEIATMQDSKEVIMMTNTASEGIPTINVKPNVNEADAKAGVANRADVKVDRVVSRAILTVVPNTGENWKIKNKDKNQVLASITSVEYAVGQSNPKFFFIQNRTGEDWTVPNPVYDYSVNLDDWKNNSSDIPINTIFDNTGLKSFSEAKQLSTYYDFTELENKALKAESPSKFVLPVTHATANYKKGNTTYFEIRVKFKPEAAAIADGNTMAANGKDLFMGLTDKKFYDSEEKAKAMGENDGVARQKVVIYKNGIMKYILWLNPNKKYDGSEGKITKSPTVRNQVYHAHISGFKEIGLPNNPLDPKDPNDPNNPDNPIKPDDPLQTDQTYLSVSVTVLPWTIHSYSVDLGNDY